MSESLEKDLIEVEQELAALAGAPIALIYGALLAIIGIFGNYIVNCLADTWVGKSIWADTPEKITCLLIIVVGTPFLIAELYALWKRKKAKEKLLELRLKKNKREESTLSQRRMRACWYRCRAYPHPLLPACHR